MTLHPDDITLAARVMTDAEPPDDLEAKIKRRLDREMPKRPTVTRRPVVAGLAAALATVVIAVALRSPEVPESRGPEVPGEVAGLRGPAVPQLLPRLAPDAEPRDLGTAERRNPAADRGTPGPQDSGTSSVRSEAEVAWMSRRIPALEVIDPLAVDRMTFESIQPDAMLITPLTITPLVTSPVHGDPDAGRQQFD